MHGLVHELRLTEGEGGTLQDNHILSPSMTRQPNMGLLDSAPAQQWSQIQIRSIGEESKCSLPLRRTQWLQQLHSIPIGVCFLTNLLFMHIFLVPLNLQENKALHCISFYCFL